MNRSSVRPSGNGFTSGSVTRAISNSSISSELVKFKAAILESLNANLVIDEVELPTLSFGQVLVRVQYSGICGAQINEIDGTKGPDRFLPHLLGHEGSGTVLEVGIGVKTVKVDDRVVLHWRQGDGLQSETPTYRRGGRTVNAGWVTTFNEYAIVSENRMTVIPPTFVTLG